jgi:DNA-binding winged helix-turn-helix (wHTH) protein/tetratricopeptide (TPR) repeat protein
VILTLTDRTVDLETGLVSTGARLRPLEQRLLSALAEARGGVLSQGELLSTVFGYSPTTRTNTLYTTVHRLRDKLERDPDAPVHLLSHRGEGYSLEASSSQPARELPRTNLAPEVDAFVGREALLGQLASLTAPLVTLVGPGGAGKTRLAIRHALSCAAPGVAMVPLESEPDALGATTRAVQARESSWEALSERLLLLPGWLLVLDTAEARLSEVRDLVERIRRAELPVRVLVTSRLPLGLAGEHRLEVGPLEAGEALALLQQRVTELGVAELPQDEALALLLERLDGLPLAIELAAGWLAALPPAELLKRWQSLASIRSDRPARHLSLDATLDWTWSLLSPEEQHAAGCLSALQGRFGLAAAQAALSAEVPDAVAMLVRLHERGLVSRPRLRGDQPFVQLHTVRLAVRQRTPARTLQQASQRLAGFLVGQVQLVPGRAIDPGQDLEGAIAALREPAQKDPRAAVALCELLGRQGWQQEREEVARAALQQASGPWAVRLRLQLAAAMRGQARPEEGVRCCEQILAETAGEPLLRGHALYELAMLALGRCDSARVDALLAQMDELLAGGDPADPRWQLLRGHRCRVASNTSTNRGRSDLAVPELQEAERAYRAAGWVVEAAWMQMSLGSALSQLGHWDAGRQALEAVRERLLALGEHRGAAKVRASLGYIWITRDLERARHELHEAAREARQAGYLPAELSARSDLALLLLGLGRWQEALEHVREASRLCRPGEAEQNSYPWKETEIRILTTGGQLLEAERLARLRRSEAEQLGLPARHLRLSIFLAEILLFSARAEEGAECLQQSLQRCPESVSERTWAGLLLAEILRAAGRPAEALAEVQAVLARPVLNGQDVFMGTALSAALMVELGDLQGEQLILLAERELPAVADPMGGMVGWLQLSRARIARATGRPLPPAPTAPPSWRTLQWGIDELYGTA